MVEVTINSVASPEKIATPNRSLDGSELSLVRENVVITNGVEPDGQRVMGAEAVEKAITKLAGVVEKTFLDSDLAFEFNEDADKLVVQVREVGSDKLIRQFPPEEFIQLAEFLESQDPAIFSEGYLKGLLFDRVI